MTVYPRPTQKPVRMLYVGRQTRFSHKTALVGPSGSAKIVLAQFDDATLEDDDGTQMGFCWHPFGEDEFAPFRRPSPLLRAAVKFQCRFGAPPVAVGPEAYVETHGNG